MSKASLEDRVAVLEREDKQGWRSFIGMFAGDSLFEEAMRHGREYRESTKPKPRRKKRANNGRA
jgi:hypothetical protein